MYPDSDPPGNGPSSYFTVDWDATGDRWNENAEVVIGDANDPGRHYSRNTPGQRLWETTLCVGDMSNNGVVGFSDINPFVAALADPSTYALLLPGLAGSMVYHGDANCDGTLGFADINPFVALVAAGKCGFCSGDNGMNRMNQMSEGAEEDAGALNPEQLAAILAANVAPELYDDLVELVGDAATQDETEEGAAYWEAVYFALTQ